MGPSLTSTLIAVASGDRRSRSLARHSVSVSEDSYTLQRCISASVQGFLLESPGRDAAEPGQPDRPRSRVSLGICPYTQVRARR